MSFEFFDEIVEEIQLTPPQCVLHGRFPDFLLSLHLKAPEGLMDVGVNDNTYWCPGVEVNVALLQPSFPQSDKKDLSAPLATEPRAPSR